jgi:hypothetical protein
MLRLPYEIKNKIGLTTGATSGTIVITAKAEIQKQRLKVI